MKVRVHNMTYRFCCDLAPDVNDLRRSNLNSRLLRGLADKTSVHIEARINSALTASRFAWYPARSQSRDSQCVPGADISWSAAVAGAGIETSASSHEFRIRLKIELVFGVVQIVLRISPKMNNRHGDLPFSSETVSGHKVRIAEPDQRRIDGGIHLGGCRHYGRSHLGGPPENQNGDIILPARWGILRMDDNSSDPDQIRPGKVKDGSGSQRNYVGQLAGYDAVRGRHHDAGMNENSRAKPLYGAAHRPAANDAAVGEIRGGRWHAADDRCKIAADLAGRGEPRRRIGYSFVGKVTLKQLRELLVLSG